MNNKELSEVLTAVATKVAHSTADLLSLDLGVRVDAVLVLQLPEGQGGVTIGACTIESDMEGAVKSVRRALEQAYETVLSQPAPDHLDDAVIRAHD